MFPSLLEFFPLLLSLVKWLCCHCKSVGEWETQNKFLVKRLLCRLPPPIPPRAVIEKLKYLLQSPQILTLRRFTWSVQNWTPTCTPHLPTLYRTMSADSVPIITLEWRDFVGSPVAWFYSALSALSSMWIERKTSWQKRVPLLCVTSKVLSASHQGLQRGYSTWLKKPDRVPESPAVFPSGDVEGTHIFTILHFCAGVLCILPEQIGRLYEWTLMRIPKPEAALFAERESNSLTSQGWEAQVSGARCACLIYQQHESDPLNCFLAECNQFFWKSVWLSFATNCSFLNSW